MGGLTREAAAHVGLAEGTLVAQGGADAFIGMIGLGVLRPGQLALLTGGGPPCFTRALLYAFMPSAGE